MKQAKPQRIWLALMLLGLLLTSCGRTFELTTSEGEKLPSAHFEGRWLLINYWAIWCAPCREEVQELNAFAGNNPQVRVVGVNFDNVAPTLLRQHISELDIRFPVVTSDPGAYFGVQERVSVLPTTLLVHPDGFLIRTLIGPQTETSLSRAIEQAMALP